MGYAWDSKIRIAIVGVAPDDEHTGISAAPIRLPDDAVLLGDRSGCLQSIDAFALSVRPQPQGQDEKVLSRREGEGGGGDSGHTLFRMTRCPIRQSLRSRVISSSRLVSSSEDSGPPRASAGDCSLISRARTPPWDCRTGYEGGGGGEGGCLEAGIAITSKLISSQEACGSDDNFKFAGRPRAARPSSPCFVAIVLAISGAQLSLLNTA